MNVSDGFWTRCRCAVAGVEEIAAWPGANECSVKDGVSVGSKGRDEVLWASRSVRMVASAVTSAEVSSSSSVSVVSSSVRCAAEVEGWDSDGCSRSKSDVGIRT